MDDETIQSRYPALWAWFKNLPDSAVVGYQGLMTIMINPRAAIRRALLDSELHGINLSIAMAESIRNHKLREGNTDAANACDDVVQAIRSISIRP